MQNTQLTLENLKVNLLKVALKEGPVDPVEMVDAYIAANEALWKVQKK